MKTGFYSPTRIVFGAGCIGSLPDEMASFGKRILLITGKSVARAEAVTQLLKKGDYSITSFSITGEPSLRTATDGVALAKSNNCDTVISFGGGSVIDTGKAIAALMNNPGHIENYLEVIGEGKHLQYPSTLHIAIPTTAGTGAEVTRNAVLFSPEHQIKISLRSNFLYPTLAIVDPDLLRTLPPHLAASTGLDALTQCIESYVSVKSTFFTDALSRDGMIRAFRSLPIVCSGSGTSDAFTDMAYASLVSGMALANSGLGAVHGFAAAIGGMCNLPHGVICARLLPQVIDANVKQLTLYTPSSPALHKYAELASLLQGNATTVPSDIAVPLKRFYATLPLDEIKKTSIDSHHFPAIVASAQNASSMKGNPVQLTDATLHKILETTFA